MKNKIIFITSGILAGVLLLGNIFLFTQNQKLEEELSKYQFKMPSAGAKNDETPKQNETPKPAEVSNGTDDEQIQAITNEFLEIFFFTDTRLDPAEYPSYDGVLTRTGLMNLENYIGRPEKGKDPEMYLEQSLYQSSIYNLKKFDNTHATVIATVYVETLVNNEMGISGDYDPQLLRIELKNNDGEGWKVNAISFIKSMYHWNERDIDDLFNG